MNSQEIEPENPLISFVCGDGCYTICMSMKKRGSSFFSWCMSNSRSEIEAQILSAVAIVKKSCFTEKWGTPRQAGLAGDSAALIELRENLDDIDANFFEALNFQFSHVLILFIFHLNKVKH